MQTYKSFAAMAGAIKAQEYDAHKADRDAAAKLRRASSLPKPKLGPKVAR